MIDMLNEIDAVQREVGVGRVPAGEGRVVRLRRTYDAPIGDVWDALTNPERIGRWFLPISGDYRLGGHYQFEGNAGGTILGCDRPRRLHATWVMGEMAGPSASEVEVLLTEAGDEATTVELVHTAIVPDEMWDQYGPGAVGVGWDGGVLGLALHLRGGSVGDPIAWQLSPEGREFFTRSSEAWGAANTAAGADPDAAARAVVNTTAFYAPDPDAAS
ncbi:MAG: SRPBCC family protein [Candidatus Limnocylindrales bacterium]